MRSTCARNPASSAVSPLRLPNSSTTAMRSWLAAVVRSALIASTDRLTAVEKPMQQSVPKTSLSIVFGTEITGTPSEARCAEKRKVPSPPSVTITSTPAASITRMTCAVRSPPATVRGSVREVWRMVPPARSMPRTRWRVSATVAVARLLGSLGSASRSPCHPRRKPTASHPRSSAPRATARMHALSPGTSPPPVRTPIRISRP